MDKEKVIERLLVPGVLLYVIPAFSIGWDLYDFLKNYISSDLLNLIYLLITISGLILILSGCFIWLKSKNRSLIYSLFGIISPVGLIGIQLLKNRSANNEYVSFHE